MAPHYGHSNSNQGVCSPGVFRLVLFLLSLVLVGYIVGAPVVSKLVGRNQSACPPCVCDCSSDAIFSLPLGLINNSLADCDRHDPDVNAELKKDIIDLLTEEISLQKNVTSDTIEHTKTSILEARKTSSQYQKEAEKCTLGMETCESAREMAEAELRAERKQTDLWEKRARERGWKDLRKAYI